MKQALLGLPTSGSAEAAKLPEIADCVCFGNEDMGNPLDLEESLSNQVVKYTKLALIPTHGTYDDQAMTMPLPGDRLDIARYLFL